jgi:hypothetical protein
VLDKIGKDREVFASFDIRIKTEDEEKYTIHFRLLEVVDNGIVAIHCQNIGRQKGWL